MGIRDTSREACHDTAEIRSECQLKILTLVKKRGPMTRREVSAETGLETSCVSGRVKELLDAGVLKELDQPMACPITHRNVHWIEAA